MKRKKFLLPLNLWGGSQDAFEWHDSKSSQGQPGRRWVSLQDLRADSADLWLLASGCCNSRMGSHTEPARFQDERVGGERERKRDKEKWIKRTRNCFRCLISFQCNKFETHTHAPTSSPTRWGGWWAVLVHFTLELLSSTAGRIWQLYALAYTQTQKLV